MRTYTIAGASSDIGQEVVKQLEGLGYNVRKVSRSSGIPIDNQEKLTESFSGADAAYVVIPFDMQAPDLHRREDEIGRKLTEAIAASGVRRVVFLSASSAHLKKGTGLGAAMMEERLNGLGIPELIHLRCTFFMENFMKMMNFRQQAVTGVFGSTLSPGRKMPMIACKDISQKVVELLTTENFPDTPIIEMLGGGDYTFVEATRILADALGISGVRYLQVPAEEAQKAMVEAGVSQSFAEEVIKTAQSFNNGDQWAFNPRTADNTSPTTLEAWARNHFKA